MDRSSPWVEIVEQPAARVSFQRGKDVKNTPVCIHGEHSSRKKKTCPNIKVHGYSGTCTVVVSCVSEHEPYKPHPNNLIGPCCKKGVYTVRVRKSDTIDFLDLIIHKARKKDFESELKLRKEINVDPYQTGFKYKVSDIDLTAVRLCFQVFLPGGNGKITRAVPPVVSQPIYDEKHGDRTSGGFLKKHLFHQVEEQSELCDVTIQVGTWTRKYHWCVLCVIPFFARLYASRMKERRTGIINLSIGSPSSVQSTLDFLYGQEPDVELHTAYDLMETADFLMIDELKNICMKTIKSFTVSSKTCLTLLSISSRFDIFFPKLDDFYLSHLPELMKQGQMLQIDKEAVRQILTDKTLSYVSRDDVTNFLLRWTAFSSERKSDFREMLSYLKKDELSCEIKRTIHDAHPDLENMIHESHLESHFTSCKNQVTLKENDSNVFVLYPPEQKLSKLFFYGFGLKNECWYRIPVQSKVLPRVNSAIAHGKDTLFTLDMNVETLSVFNLASGQHSEKKLIFQESAYVLAVHAPLAVSGQRIYIAKNFHNIVLNTNVEGLSLDGSPPDLVRVETSAVVYVSANLESPEINMKPQFSIDYQVDMMCVAAGDLLCLLSQTNQQLMVHCLKRHIKTSINLSSYNLVAKGGTLSSSGSHVYILADNLVVVIGFEASPKKILWKAHTVLPNETLYSSSLFLCHLTQDKIVKHIEDDKTRELTLKWQEIGITESTKKIHNIYIPQKLSHSEEYQLIQLQLPKQALKCHIDCPHCKDKETEQLDLFSYQQTFSSDEESADEESYEWSLNAIGDSEESDIWSDDSGEEI